VTIRSLGLKVFDIIRNMKRLQFFPDGKGERRDLSLIRVLNRRDPGMSGILNYGSAGRLGLLEKIRSSSLGEIDRHG